VLRAGVLRVIEAAHELPWRELRADLERFVAVRAPARDVDDIVQDALVRIHRGVGAVRDQERLGAWVFRVARSAIVDHLRRVRPGEELADEPPAERDDGIDDTTFTRLASCLTPFVALLPAVYRQAITLVELEGLSQVEAARRLGTPVSTMKARVQRGRARLRELVEECCAVGLDARGHVVDVTPRSVGDRTCKC
jgi:RNA polymerase sigma-70 factor (ECF subfamily)